MSRTDVTVWFCPISSWPMQHLMDSCRTLKINMHRKSLKVLARSRVRWQERLDPMSPRSLFRRRSTIWNILLMMSLKRGKKLSHRLSGYRIARSGDVSIWKERAWVVWVWHHQSRQDLWLVIVGRVDQGKAIPQDPVGGRVQKHEVLQVTQCHVAWYNWVQSLPAADSIGPWAMEVKVWNSQKDNEDWPASVRHEHGRRGQRQRSFSSQGSDIIIDQEIWDCWSQSADNGRWSQREGSTGRGRTFFGAL